jgi:chromosome segregation ATPase
MWEVFMTRVSSAQFSTFLTQMEGKLGHPVGKESPEKKMELLNKRIGLLQESIGKIEKKQSSYSKGFIGAIRSRFRSIKSKDQAPLARSKTIVTRMQKEIDSLEGDLGKVMSYVFMKQKIEDKRTEVLAHKRQLKSELRGVNHDIKTFTDLAGIKTNQLDAQSTATKQVKKKKHFRKKTKEKQNATVTAMEQTKFTTAEAGQTYATQVADLTKQKRQLDTDIEKDGLFLGELEAMERKIPEEV